MSGGALSILASPFSTELISKAYGVMESKNAPGPFEDRVTPAHRVISEER